MTADLTALWHAAAPPPPPPGSSVSSASNSKPHLPLDGALSNMSNRFDITPFFDSKLAPITSLSFDVETKSDHLPEDTYSPDPSRPTSRASSTSGTRSRTPSMPSPSQSQSYDFVCPAPQSPQQQPNSQKSHFHAHTQSERQRTMSYTGGDHYAAWHYPHAPHITHGPHVPPVTSHIASFNTLQGYGEVNPQPQPSQHQYQHTPLLSMPQAPQPYQVWPSVSPTASAPQERQVLAHRSPYQSERRQSLPHSATVPSPSLHDSRVQISSGSQYSLAGPVPPPRARSPRPLSMPMAPQAVVPTSTSASLVQLPSQAFLTSSPTPLSPTRTIRRSLPQPPGPPTAVPATPATSSPLQAPAHPNPALQGQDISHPTFSTSSLRYATSASCSSTVSRSESVRMAAEQLMSRGPPRRAGGTSSRFCRFNSRSPLSDSAESETALASTSSSESSLRSAAKVLTVQSSQSEPTGMNQRRKRADEEVTVLSGRMSMKDIQMNQRFDVQAALEMSKIDEVPSRPSSRGPRDNLLNNRPTGDRVNLPHSHGLPNSPALPHAPSVAFTAPDSVPFALPIPTVPSSQACPVVALQQRGALAPATIIPRIYSPPPNVAPPVDPIVGAADTCGPVISISAPEDEAAPNSGPVINISAPDDGQRDVNLLVGASSADEEGSTLHVGCHHQRIPSASTGASTTSVSLHSGQGQRATATTTNMVNAVANSTTLPHSTKLLRAEPQPQSASSVAGIVCSASGCGKYIAGRVISAALSGQPHYYHPECFTCSHCDEPLEHVAFYHFEGKPYCHFDYYELWAKRCFHCRTPIVDERFIRVDDPELVGAGDGNEERTRYYHDLHFFCANCGDPFLDPKSAGSMAASLGQLRGVMDAGPACKPFVVHKGYPYCSECHDNLHLPKCKGCKGSIRTDQEMLSALKAKWHEECLRCKRCHGSFRENGPGGGRMFVNDEGDVYDEGCYKIWLRSTL